MGQLASCHIAAADSASITFGFSSKPSFVAEKANASSYILPRYVSKKHAAVSLASSDALPADAKSAD
jgi:hypothetical protein